MNLTGDEIIEILNEKIKTIEKSTVYVENKMHKLERNKRKIPDYLPKRISSLTRKTKELKNLIEYLKNEDVKRIKEVTQ